MTNRTSILFPLVTLLLVITAVVSSYQRAPQTEVEKAPLYADMLDNINNITTIRIQDDKYRTEIKRNGDQWLMMNRDGYPAIFNKVKDAVLSIARLQVLEGKTRNPELYTRLDVEGTEQQPGKSTLVSFTDQQGETLAALVVGKTRKGNTPGQAPSLYVRKIGDEQSLLVEGSVNIPADPARWMSNLLFDIKSARISELLIQHADGTEVHVTRSEPGKPDVKLQDIAADYRLKSQATLNGLVTALEEFRFQDVMGLDSFSNSTHGGGEHTTTTLKTYDGIVVTATTHKLGSRYMTDFEFKYQTPANPPADVKPEEIKAFVEQVSAQTRGWKFDIPAFKATMLTRSRDSLLRKDEPVE